MPTFEDMDRVIESTDSKQTESDDEWEPWIVHVSDNLQHIKKTMESMSDQLGKCEQRILPIQKSNSSLHLCHKSKWAYNRV